MGNRFDRCPTALCLDDFPNADETQRNAGRILLLNAVVLWSTLLEGMVARPL